MVGEGAEERNAVCHPAVVRWNQGGRGKKGKKKKKKRMMSQAERKTFSDE